MNQDTNEHLSSEAPMEEESFAAMLEAQESGPQVKARVGDKVRGAIIAVTKDSVFIDAGLKIDGVADKAEFLDAEGNFPHEVGEVVELYVVKAGGGELRLSRAASGDGSSLQLQEAYAARLPVQGKVKGTCKGGYNVQIMGKRAFCPISQIDAQYVSDPDVHVGQEYTFLIVTCEDNGRNVVVSRRKLLEAEQQEAAEKFQAEVQPGAVMQAKVVRIKPFGVFAELAPGVEGMIHVSELGYGRVAQPQDVVREGEMLTVKILAVEPDPKRKGLRISLSVKQAQADPWEQVSGRYAKGGLVEGTVVRLAPFGAFVELEPGIEGLVHISELSYTKRVHKPEDVVSVGERVQVAIKDLDLEQRRIGLSLREAQGDPWSGVADRYAVGSLVQGTVEKREQFGLFVNLEPGVTGLMPKSLMGKALDPAALESLKPGDQVRLKVDALDVDARKITLAPVDTKEEEAKDWRKELPPPAAKDEGGLGGLNSLGAKFQEALAKKQGK